MVGISSLRHTVVQQQCNRTKVNVLGLQIKMRLQKDYSPKLHIEELMSRLITERKNTHILSWVNIFENWQGILLLSLIGDCFLWCNFPFGNMYDDKLQGKIEGNGNISTTTSYQGTSINDVNQFSLPF